MNKNIYSSILLLFILVFGCSSDESIQNPVQQEEDQIEEIQKFSFLALGDSYTIGQGVTESESWPFQLQNAFASNTQKIETVKVIAQTGWTTGNLISAIDTQNPENYDIVSLLIGVNNQFQGADFTIFQSEFNFLLDKAISLAGNNKNRVFVVSIPDYGVTPFGSNNSEVIASEIDMYNAYIKQQCEAQSIPFIDVTSISRNLGNSEGALATDNLHPSANQYSLWVEAILPVVKEILE
ncbi:SGNH/GDSL hydrolase family protein [Aquimarina litoralis]|uniref:SGNH/GDSL hydrolase family protein n=1 Tax=Aquimarina litoralis TaxID=584605 RepID=UPI001C5927E9|nr:SGNH/GDSL hydrolase family protein [Aquimarina litoralis]MBW1293959.1 SGNH/GDSL hydrolase family protein [Aquimarina litoralis]